MVAVRELFAILDIEVDDKNIKKANKEFDKGIEKLKEFGSAAGKIALGVVGAFGAIAAGAIYAVKETADYIDKLQDTADALGVTIEELQTYQYAADRAGVASETFQNSLATIQQGLGKAGDDASAAAKEYKALGIEQNKANAESKTSAEIFDELHAAYQTGDSEKQAHVVKLLGGTYKKVIPILNKTSEEFKQLRDHGAELGVATQKQSDISGKLNDTWDDLGRTLKSYGLIILEIIGPGLTKIGEYTIKLVNIFKSFFTTISGDKSIEDFADSFLKFIDEMYSKFLDFLISFVDGLIKIKEITKSVIEFIDNVWKNWKGTLVFIASFIAGELVVSLAKWVVQLALVSAGWLKVAIAQAAAIATNPVTWIIAGIALLIAAIYKIYKNWDMIVSFFKKTINAIGALFTYIFNALPTPVQNSIKLIMLIISSFVSWYFNIWKSILDFMIDWGSKIGSFVSGVWDGIKQGFMDAFNSMFNFAKETLEKISKLPGIKQVLSFVGGAADATKAGWNNESVSTSTRAGNLPVSNNIESSQTNNVGQIIVNGAGDTKDVANKVVDTIKTGGNSTTYNAVTNKRVR